MKFTQMQLSNWRAYESVRLGGRFNMLDPRARQLTGLTDADYLFVLDNFVPLRDAALASLKVTK